ncbi:MAG: hypothetical protein Q9197_002857 [Variospora fuerteventurae]
MGTASTNLGPIFDRLGLGRYLDRFLDEGFETWETVVDITESDLCVHSGSVKLGHRRRLQREIANARGVDLDIITTATSSSKPHHVIQLDADDSLDLPPAGGPGRAKRKYRRHPKTVWASFIANLLLYEKADTYAPDRPQSAYVVFSNKVREDLKSENLSFTEMAKRVGEMWQALATEEREPFEAQAGSAKEEYLAEMAQYRLSSNYKAYAEYLADFKAKHPSSADGKKPRLESHASTTSSGSIEIPSDSVELPHHDAPPMSARSPSGLVLDTRQPTRTRTTGLTSPHVAPASSRGSRSPSVASVTSSAISAAHSRNPAPRQLSHATNLLTHASTTCTSPLPPVASLERRDSSSTNSGRLWFTNQTGSSSATGTSPLSNYRRSYHPPPSFVRTKGKSSSSTSRSPPSSALSETTVLSKTPQDDSQGYRLLRTSSRASGQPPMDGVDSPGSNDALEIRSQPIHGQGGKAENDVLPAQLPSHPRTPLSLPNHESPSAHDSSFSSLSLHGGSPKPYPHAADSSIGHSATSRQRHPSQEVLPRLRREGESSHILRPDADPLAVLAYAGDIHDRHSRQAC